MARRAGSADLPLHGGRVPLWLAGRMTRLGAVIAEAIVHAYGRDELLRRLAHPFWFQSFGAVMGMDWHSSGTTTSVIGALKRGLEPTAAANRGPADFAELLASDVVKSAAKRAYEKGARETDLIRVREVTASRGKVLRAEPVSLLWEQGRVLMRPGMEALELEMLQFSREWDRAVHGSPNRLDEMIRSMTRLAKVVTNIPIA
jgi:hypothetical protein